MAAKKSESVNIRKYKGKRELNIGIFLFVIVLFYLIVTLVLYLSEDTPSVYEVREGSIVKDTSYTGLIIRDEQDIKSEGSGYIYYYFNDNSKIKAGANVYALVPSRLETGSSDSAKASTSVNSEVQTSITHRIENFNDSFTEMDFSTVYSLKDEINTYLQSNVSETKMQQLDTVIAASGQSVSSYPSSADGIMTFSTDGMEELTKDTFTAEDFDRTEYSQKELTDQVKVKKEIRSTD
ncbi:MAG: HlyD family efflux transporter periplasmic adaptor subunit [[Ruminococcus] lactaris]